MKRIITLALALALAVAVKAELVRPDVAAAYAKGILGMKQAPAPERMVSMRVAGRDGQTAPDYYIFNNPDGGWVIIAADDRVNPVVGYSREGSFPANGIPDNIRWWMDGVSDMIDAVRESGVEASDAVKAAWKSAPAGTRGAAKVELETAQWSQGSPYNDQCPIVTGENIRSVTGCVATAMAIIMRYNRWPAHGKGVIGGYTTTTAKTYIPAYSIDDHEYDWDNLPLSNASLGSAGWTSAQKSMVAQIMHDCGVAVNMDYTSKVSGTASGDMLVAMQNNMSFSESSVLVSRSSYRLDEWYSLITNEIDNGRVVYYGGDGDGGGHAFVCDGYDTDGSKLRINWGWGGAYNGFFTLDLYDADLDLDFANHQEAIIGLAPDTAQVELDNVVNLACFYYDGLYGIEPDGPTDIKKGTAFKFNLGWFMNSLNKDLTADLKICIEDKDGKTRQEGWYYTLKIPASDGYIYSDNTANDVLSVSPDLTDRFRLYIKNAGGQWEPMHGNYDILPDVDGIVCGVTRDPVIVVPDGCAAGQEIDLLLSYGFTHVKSVRWSVNGTALDGNRVRLVQGANAIRADVIYLDDTKGSIFRTLQLE